MSVSFYHFQTNSAGFLAGIELWISVGWGTNLPTYEVELIRIKNAIDYNF